LVGQGL